MDQNPDAGGSPGGPIGTPQIDARREPRVAVSWRAMIRMANGRVFEVRVRDVSESGLGMMSDHGVPHNAVVEVAVAVPDLTDATRSITVKGKFRAVFVVIQRDEYRIGGQWTDLDNPSREMLKQHIKRQRYSGG